MHLAALAVLLEFRVIGVNYILNDVRSHFLCQTFVAERSESVVVI